MGDLFVEFAELLGEGAAEVWFLAVFEWIPFV